MIFRLCLLVRMCLSRVVLPAPRKPVMMQTGSATRCGAAIARFSARRKRLHDASSPSIATEQLCRLRTRCDVVQVEWAESASDVHGSRPSDQDKARTALLT